jgi:hypothetical protein
MIGMSLYQNTPQKVLGKKIWPDINMAKINPTAVHECNDFQAVEVEIALKQLNHKMKDEWKKR